tara:strand:+ start:3251 stop:3484 length:234 start_codon:yes stop_codon:yes gene_type:complete
VDRIISEKFGCKIIDRDNKTFIQYDNGQSASWTVENEITLKKAKLAMLASSLLFHPAKLSTPIAIAIIILFFISLKI